MEKVECEVVIDHPVERVFPFVADLETWRQWHGGEQEVEKVTPGQIGVGTTWRVSGPVQGKLIEGTIEVTRYEPNGAFAIETTSGPIEARQAFRFEALVDGTRLVTLLELADPDLVEPARQQWDQDLRVLKGLLERQAMSQA